MSAIYKTLFALVDAKSGVHTFLGGVGLIGLAIWQFSQNDPESGMKSLSLGAGVLGIGLKQHATAGEVGKVVDATVTTVPETPK